MMFFLCARPMFEAVALLVLPQLLGTRDLPFPRLSAFGYWSFLIGGVFVAGSIFFDAAPDGGWFMYPPLTTETSLSGIGADIWMLRSEEHTSELQSLMRISYAVFCLKKKTTHNITLYNTSYLF